jgi:hypothetical protein
MLPVLIPFDDEVRQLLEELETTERVGEIARRLQPYVVQIYPIQLARLCGPGVVQPVAPERFGEQFCALVRKSLYRDDVGLTWDDPSYRSAEENILCCLVESRTYGGLKHVLGTDLSQRQVVPGPSAGDGDHGEIRRATQ